MHKPEQADLRTGATAAAPIASPPKVDFATDLFNMLSMDGPSENGSDTCHDDNAWAGFQCMFYSQNVTLFLLFSPLSP